MRRPISMLIMINTVAKESMLLRNRGVIASSLGLSSLLNSWSTQVDGYHGRPDLPWW